MLNGISDVARCVDQDPETKGATQHQKAMGTEPRPIHKLRQPSGWLRLPWEPAPCEQQSDPKTISSPQGLEGQEQET